MPSGGWSRTGIAVKVPPIPTGSSHPMTLQNQPGAKARIAPAGLVFLAITSIGWGFNWPVTKYLLGELPPLTLRGTTGVVGASLLALLAISRGQNCDRRSGRQHVNLQIRRSFAPIGVSEWRPREERIA